MKKFVASLFVVAIAVTSFSIPASAEVSINCDTIICWDHPWFP